MNKTIALVLGAMLLGTPKIDATTMIGKSSITLKSDLMSPEALWAMGRIGTAAVSPDGKQVVYQVSYYSVKENKSHTVLYIQSTKAGKAIVKPVLLTSSQKSESDPSWIEGGKKIAFLRDGQLWKMNADGTERTKLSDSKIDIEGYKFSPDGRKVILIKSLPYHESIKKNPEDLPLATGRVVTDLNYRHWDHYVESVAHPFVANVNGDKVDEGEDILKGEPYECPMAPFGGIEQLDWSKDSKNIAYTCRKKTGVDYAVSTDADIYLYNVSAKTTRNLCKPEGYKEPKIDPTKSMRNQAVNHQKGDMQVGYDVNPQFSPDGQYIAWQSMARDGYESDRNRLCVMNLSTGKKQYVTESFDSNVDAFVWSNDSKTIYFTGCWHATENVYQTNLEGNVMQISKDEWADYGSLQMIGTGMKDKSLLVTKHSMTHPDDLYVLTPNGKKAKSATLARITEENKQIYDQLALPTIQQRWVTTTDGKQELVWIILPPHFDSTKKYPTLLYCEGGPQSPVSQFWSYRWNFSIMAAHGYIIVAPNRRGLPGFGSAWNEEVSQASSCATIFRLLTMPPTTCLMSTRTGWVPWVPASVASLSIILQDITTSVLSVSLLMTVLSTLSRCIPTRRRLGSATGSMRMLIGTRTRRKPRSAHTRTVLTALWISGTRLSSAYMVRRTIASTQTRALEHSTPRACVAYLLSSLSSLMRTTGC